MDLLLPDLSVPVQASIRAVYGTLLLLHLLWTLPHARRFFLSERWGGYGQSAWDVDAVQNPAVLPALLAAWLACAVCLIVGAGGWLPALVNLFICRYFFLGMRWKGVLRGMGAPGYFCCWMAAAVFLLEFTAAAAPAARRLALLVLQVDFALIMFVAGWYKFNAGYFNNEGMEYGLVNPQWGYWWQLYRWLPPGHWFFRLNNQMAWLGEVVAGLLMLFPATRFYGALFILVSFVYIGLNIRLLVLAPMVMLACVLYFGPGTMGAPWLALLPAAPGSTSPGWQLPVAVVVGLEAFLCGYAVLLPVAYGGLFWNFYRRAALPGCWQALLDAYANWFGLILWRVFSADHTCFWIQIARQPRTGGARTVVSRWGLHDGLRYSHVGEAIAVTSLFTTLQYYPSNPGLFRERLLRYARTIDCLDVEVLVFKYHRIHKRSDAFEDRPAAEFIVDVGAGTVAAHSLDPSVQLQAPRGATVVQETQQPGSYAPRRAG